MRILMLFIFLTTAAYGQEINIPSLKVIGRGSVQAPADTIRLSAGVVTQGATALEALHANNEKGQSILSSLQDAGLKESEYKTGHFSIQPIYRPQPHPLPTDWKPEIIGFEVSNSLTIETDKIDQVGDIIDTLTAAGANNIQDILFTVKDNTQFKKDALIKAVQSAMDDAKTLSNAAHVSLVRMIKLSVNDSNLPKPYMAKAFTAESVPIIPGNIEVSAEVIVEYEIRGAN